MKLFTCKIPAIFIAIVALISPAIAQEQPAPKMKKIAFLGVGTCDITESLRQHLELPEGFGLQIVHIVEKSPVAKAGVKPHDVLVKFNEQRLTSPRHLAVLVRSYQPSDKIKLTFIRKGKEEVVAVVLGEREVPESMSRRGWQHAVEKYQNQWLSQNGHPKKLLLKPTTQAKGKPPAVSVRPGFPVQIFSTPESVKIDNQLGEVTITRSDDGHEITLKDKSGEIIHEGSYDPKKGTQGLPKKAQDHLKKMKLDDLKILTPGALNFHVPAEATPEKATEIDKISEPLPAEKPAENNHASCHQRFSKSKETT